MSYWTKRRKLLQEVRETVEGFNPYDATNTAIIHDFTQRDMSSARNTSIVECAELPGTSLTSSCTDIHEENSEAHDTFGVTSFPCIDASDEFENVSDSDESVDFVDENDTDKLITDIRCWATKHKVTHAALGDLLIILRKTFPELPKSAKTVLQSEKIKHDIVGGSYVYRGIATELLSGRHIEGISDRTIAIQINVDGLPLFKSSTVQLWPILGLVENYNGILQCNRQPFVIALYCDNSKPKDITAFLADFVHEVNELQNQGLVINGHHYVVKISAIICDTPARAFIKCTRGHGAYNGCDKCEQHGEYVGRVTFPQTNAALRTDISFARQSDNEHHTAESPLAQTSIGLISQVPADYMHLSCLGVMRKLVYIWIKGPLKTRLGPRVIARLSEKMLDMRPFVCSEFARKPRSFSEFQRFKATEWRQLLLYTGMVCLRDILPKPLYDNFMLFCVGMTILLSESLCGRYADYAHTLLTLFVEHVANVYGSEFLTYNMHSLVHLVQDAKRFGPLDNVSAFPFENYLCQLKTLVRKPSLPLQQVINRLSELDAVESVLADCKNDSEMYQLKKEHFDGPLCIGVNVRSQHRMLLTNKFCVKVACGDNCFRLSSGLVIVVKNIIESTNDQIYVIYCSFEKVDNFFTYPCNSEDVEIFMVSSLAIQLSYCLLSEIKRKYVLFPYKTSFVAIPLLHF
jgi:Domain of unknown function (DUF4218)